MSSSSLLPLPDPPLCWEMGPRGLRGDLRGKCCQPRGEFARGLTASADLSLHAELLRSPLYCCVPVLRPRFVCLFVSLK